MINRRAKLDEGNIAELGYDITTKAMVIIFRDVPEYQYTYNNISAEMFCELLNAESTGQFFAKAIRPFANKFPFSKNLNNKPIK